MAGRTRSAGGLGLAAVAAAAALAWWPASGGSAVDPPRAPFGLRPGGGPFDVTLVSGDRVHVRPAGGGRHAVTVTHAPSGPRPTFSTTRRGDDLYVIPSDVAPLVPARLDRELFNVTAIAEQGLAGRPLPLIVEYARATPRALPGTGAVRTLESVNAVAVRAQAAGARRLGRAVEALDAGVEKVWLDRRVQAHLDESVPQIGAPAAWAAGHDGAGVKVAVLDSGIDTDHPDLAGAVTAERNFSEEPDTDDHGGHGTHVAAIVASRDPVRRGVAPGASLINAKVLNGGGFGDISAVIDAMEWASGEADADVVNLSLGLPPDHVEAPLLSEAVDRLAAERDALFVVAAGNEGCEGCVRSPGVAERALTVGAVGDDDALADFSGRGPVDGAIKPEVTAPGVEIVAARGNGSELGEPVGDLHMRLSGTSMAAPHVAGAAALVLDAHPETSADALKGALVSTAKPTPDVPVFHQGAGRIDAAAAAEAPVVADTSSIAYGHFRWPHAGREPVARTVAYRNRGTAPVTLDLQPQVSRRDGEPVAAGGLTVAPASVTVPAGGIAEAELRLDTAAVAPGLYGGHVAARAPGGGILRTLVSFDVEPESYDLHVRGIARDGRPAFGGFHVLDVEDGDRLYAARWLHGGPGPCTPDASDVGSCVRVRRGTYAVDGFIFTMPSAAPSDEHRRTARNTALVGTPELEVRRDAELVLDARDAEEVTVETTAHETRANNEGAAEIAVHREPERGAGFVESLLLSQVEQRVFMEPTRRVTRGRFGAMTRWRLERPDIQMDVLGRGIPLDPYYVDPTWHSENSWQYPMLDGVRQLRLVDAGTATAADLRGRDVRGALALVRRSDAIPLGEQSNRAAEAGAAMVAVYNDRPGVTDEAGEPGQRLRVPTVRLSGEEGAALLRRLARDRVLIRAEGEPASPFLYDVAFEERDRIPRAMNHVVRPRDVARLDMAYQGQPGADTSMSAMPFVFAPWKDVANSTVSAVRAAPRERREYVTAAPRVQWDHYAVTPELSWNSLWPRPEEAQMWLEGPQDRSYRGGSRHALSWLAGPVAPGLHPRRPLVRAGDQLGVSMVTFRDADGNTAQEYTSPFENGFVSDFTVYEDGVPIAWTDSVPQGTIDVSGSPAEYRIEYDVENRAPWARTSPAARSVWTFSSRRPAAGQTAVQALPTVDWEPEVDVRNRESGRRGHELGVRIGHQPGAPDHAVRAITLDVSYDDGRTWREVRELRRAGRNAWTARLRRRPPRGGSGFVSLRVHARDAVGSTVEQRVTRAYAMRR